MKKLFLILFTSLFLVTPARAGNEEMPQVVAIAGEELKKMIDDGAHFVLIDTRYDGPYWAGHIKNAVNLPSESVDSQTLDQIVPDMNTKLVFYCEGGDSNTSRIAASKALGAGYHYVYYYDGGIEDWKKLGYQVVK